VGRKEKTAKMQSLSRHGLPRTNGMLRGIETNGVGRSVSDGAVGGAGGVPLAGAGVSFSTA
jgi:hypothetical protein